jgi:hypothetical protein
MCRKLVGGIVCLTASLFGQSLVVTSPASNQTLSGFTGFAFSATAVGLPSLASIKYTVDAYDYGVARTAPYSLAWNTFLIFNGPHQVVATAYDAGGNVLAVSSPAPFTVANTWPIPWNPAMSVTTSAALSSPWSGIVNVTAAFSGSGAGDSKTINIWIDGVKQISFAGLTAASAVFPLDTTQFPNGSHVIAINAEDQTNNTAYYCGAPVPAVGAGEWSRIVTFANGNAHNYLQMNAHEVFLAPGQTFTLTGVLVNADGSTSATTVDYYSQTPNICMVDASSGLVTALARGACQVRAMAEMFSGSDLTSVGAIPTTAVQSTGVPFVYDTVGMVLRITGGNGWTPGFYEIGHTDITKAPPIANTNVPAMTTGNSGGRFVTGLSRTVWVFVNNTNILPHFGTDGSIVSSFDPLKSFYVNSIFQSMSGVNADQSYMPGFLAEYNLSGFNTLETGITNQDTGSSNQNAFQAGQATYVSGIEAALASYPKLRLLLSGDSLTRTSTALFNTTRGASANWTPSAVQTIFSSWVGQHNTPIGAPMMDEVNSSWSAKPLQGPIMFNGGAQSGLASIVASGGTCTVNWTDWSLNGASKFIIVGATTPGLTSAPGSLFAAHRMDGNTFTFTCSGVPDGTYSSSTDPNLVIEPYVAVWFASNTDYIHYTAFSQILNQANTVSGRVNITWPNAALTSYEAIANWEGNSKQSLNGISQVSECADLYWTISGSVNYLSSRYSINTLIGAMGDVTRKKYGWFDPNKPIVLETSGTTTNYGFQGYSVPISSITGNTITFASAHGLTVVYPGITRLWISGSSNPAYNANFYVLAAPTPMTLTVVRSITDFTGTGTGGTLTYQTGETETISSITATGTVACHGTNGGGAVCGDTVIFGVGDSSRPRHRGQTFTISGNSVAGFNNNTFVDLAENTTLTATYFYFRELPGGNSTGGRAQIVADNYYVKGRNGSLGYDTQPAFVFAEVIETGILRGAGHRMYALATNPQGYSPGAGFVGTLTTYLMVCSGMRAIKPISFLRIRIGRTVRRYQLFTPLAWRLYC